MKGFLFFSLILFFGHAEARVVKNDDYFLKKLYIFFSGTHNLTSDFIQKTTISDEISKGKLIVDIKNKKMRVDYEKPDRVSLIFDNEKIIYYHYELDTTKHLADGAGFYLQLLSCDVVTNVSDVVVGPDFVDFVTKSDEHGATKVIFWKNPFMISKIQYNNDVEAIDIEFFNVKTNTKIVKQTFFSQRMHSRIANYKQIP